MTRITGDDFMLIGLHKMAAERGDGLVPEMLEVLRRSGQAVAAEANLVQFPMRQAESNSGAHRASNENNVIAFPMSRRGVMHR